MKLEFGGGEFPRRPNFCQVDIRDTGKKNTICCAAWDIDKKISAGSVSEIYSRHFFEHLTHQQALRTLKAWETICIPGASIIMIVPDFAFHLYQWSNWNELTNDEKDHCRAGIWGWQREGDSSAWDLHKSGYDLKRLKEIISLFNFKDIQRLTSKNKLIPEAGHPYHLVVEFKKI